MALPRQVSRCVGGRDFPKVEIKLQLSYLSPSSVIKLPLIWGTFLDGEIGEIVRNRLKRRLVWLWSIV